MTASKLFKERVLMRERLLLAIEAHGPSVVYERIADFRALARSRDVFGLRYVKQALLDHGMYAVDAENLMHKGHSVGCACWRCVIMLRRDVERSTRKMQEATYAGAKLSDGGATQD